MSFIAVNVGLVVHGLITFNPVLVSILGVDRNLAAWRLNGFVVDRSGAVVGQFRAVFNIAMDRPGNVQINRTLRSL